MTENTNDAFKNLIDKHKGFVTSVVAKYIKNPQNIEDVVQMTFIKAWRYRLNFKGKSAYRTWVYRIAVNTAINYIAATKRHAAYHYEEVAHIEQYIVERDIGSPHTNSWLASPEFAAIAEQDFDRLLEKLKFLPESLRNVVILIFVYGLSYQEIADALSIPIGTVRSRMHRAKIMLKKLLK